jgi:insertion element IS1 protein InsB
LVDLCFKKDSKGTVSFNVGKRKNKTLSRVIETLQLSEAKKYLLTDKKTTNI